MRFAVIGDPVAHSKSPAMHMAAYKALGMEHTYGAIRATAEDLPRLVEALRGGAYDGFNVTVPHKRAILGCVDHASDLARSTNAANALVRKPARVVVENAVLPDHTVFADNTDVPALVAELRRLAPGRSSQDWARSRAIVLGSGGAAQAAKWALMAELRVQSVVMRGRRWSGGPLTPPFPAANHPLAPSTHDRDALTVIQATSAGMHGADSGEAVAAAVAWNELPADAIALDVIYAPAETPFLAAARARGLRHANGLGMLVEQGALAFELWLGVPAPRDVMLAALR